MGVEVDEAGVAVDGIEGFVSLGIFGYASRAGDAWVGIVCG